MDKLIVWMFGINRMNFYGWVLAGTLLIAVDCGLAILSLVVAANDVQWGILIMLGAIALLLLGILCVLLTIYCALLTEKLERKGELIGDVRETSKANDFELTKVETSGRDQFAHKT